MQDHFSKSPVILIWYQYQSEISRFFFLFNFSFSEARSSFNGCCHSQCFKFLIFFVYTRLLYGWPSILTSWRKSKGCSCFSTLDWRKLSSLGLFHKKSPNHKEQTGFLRWLSYSVFSLDKDSFKFPSLDSL